MTEDTVVLDAPAGTIGDGITIGELLADLSEGRSGGRGRGTAHGPFPAAPPPTSTPRSPQHLKLLRRAQLHCNSTTARIVQEMLSLPNQQELLVTPHEKQQGRRRSTPRQTEAKETVTTAAATTALYARLYAQGSPSPSPPPSGQPAASRSPGRRRARARHQKEADTDAHGCS